MNASTILSRAITAAESSSTTSAPPLLNMKEKRKALHASMVLAVEDKSPLMASEKRTFDTDYDQATVLLAQFDQRVNQLENDEQRSDAAANAYRANGGVGGFVVSDGGSTYTADNPRGPSFFRDMRNAKLGDFEASQRLGANEREQRALGNTSGTGGSGGEFAPPGFLTEQFVQYARAARVTADLLTKAPLPPGVSSINIPKVLTGTATGVQSTQNTSVVSVDPTTSQLTSGITTIAGKNVVSQQLIDQSAIAFDQMILQDLAADYARSLDLQVLSGTGTGGQLTGLLTYFNASGTSNYVYTQTSPSVSGAGGLLSAVNHAVANISTTRFLSPTAIVLHPRRWSFIASAFDGQNRPLVSLSGNGFNQVADSDTVAAQGIVGSMAGLPVYLDPNLPTTMGTGSNQDPILVGRFEDAFLWESGITMATFDGPYSDSMGVLVRVHGYTAMIPSRYPSSVAIISGTGLVSPSY